MLCASDLALGLQQVRISEFRIQSWILGSRFFPAKKPPSKIQKVISKNHPPEISGATVHPERQALLAKLQEQTDLTWTPGIVERFASDAPGSSKIYGVKGNVTQVTKWVKNKGW